MEKIPLLDLQAQCAPLRKDIDEALRAVVDSGQFILGPAVKAFEEDISRYIQSPFAIGVSNGTDAIFIALLALGIGKGDKVICPAFTYFATAGAVVRAGAVPVFCDIDPDTYNMAPDSLAAVLEKHGDIKAVIVVHLYGQPADLDPLMKLCRIRGIALIEDNAQSFGAKYRGRHAGTFGRAGTLSFFPGKNLGAFGDAGMILTADKGLADKMRSLRNQGTRPEDKYDHVLLGTNARLDTIQAAVLSVKLKHIDSWNKKREENARFYAEKLKGVDVALPVCIPHGTHVYHQFVLRSPVKDKILANLHARGIDARTYYPTPLHLQTCFKFLGYRSGDFPQSERVSREVFAIPCFPEISFRQMEYIIEAIKEALKGS